MRLTSFLTKNLGNSLFLPAHGRGAALPRDLKQLLRYAPGLWDLPEIPQFGGPLISQGVVCESQQFSAMEYGVDRCWYGVNGATGLLQAALLSIAKPGEKVLMPRNAHQSLINACVLSDINPVFFDLPYLSDRGHYLPPDINWMRKVLAEIERLKINLVAAVFVNPTYQGYSCDINLLVNEIHLNGLPVLVDEAHGTYYVNISRSDLPRSAINAGADLVVHSLHKSALGLGQSAVLWKQGDRVDPIAIERSIGWLQTSSPSSLLLASCESTLREMKSSSGQRNILRCIEEAEELRKKLLEKGIPLIDNDDPLRLVLHTGKLGINGFDADKFFISKNIIAELPEPGTITFCLGFARQRGFVRKFLCHWEDFLSLSSESGYLGYSPAPPFDLVMTTAVSCASASRSKTEEVSIEDACGRICAQAICPYPPGIPIIVPGETIDFSIVNWLIEQKALWLDQIPGKVKVVKSF